VTNCQCIKELYFVDSESKVWFPNIDKMVEETIQNCLPCQAATSGNHPPPEPLKMTQLPSGPWKEVAMDFLGPFPTGEYLLVVIDAFIVGSLKLKYSPRFPQKLSFQSWMQYFHTKAFQRF
jgi:hypothetical protein